MSTLLHRTVGVTGRPRKVDRLARRNGYVTRRRGNRPFGGLMRRVL
jgi:hypothetical protein